MTNIATVFAISILLLAAYAYLAMRMSKTAQPLRIKVVENIEDLLSDESIPKVVRDDLDKLGDSLLSRRLAWMIVFAFPVGVFYALRNREPESNLVRTHPRHKDIARVFFEGIMCIMANSPMGALVFAFEITFLMLLAVPLGRSARRALHMLFSFGVQREAFTAA